MKFRALFTASILLMQCFQAFSDEAIDHRLQDLQTAIDEGNTVVQRAFFDYIRLSGTPLVEAITGDEANKRVTFLWIGNERTQTVDVLNEASPSQTAMQRLPRTNIWFKTVLMPKDVRTAYAFFINGGKEPQKDPHNLHTYVYPEGFYSTEKETVFSVFEMPGAKPQKWLENDFQTPKGSLFQYKFPSKALQNERDVWVYYPNGHPHRGESYPLLIVFDGEAYTSLIPTPTILDNLIAAKAIPPIVAVFVSSIDQKTRSVELTGNGFFLKFLTDELIPWMHTKHYATADRGKIAVAGSSYGGLAALHAAMNRPDVIGNALSQSGAFYWLPTYRRGVPPLLLKAQNATGFPIRVYMDAGLLENEHGERGLSILAVNRQMKELLHGKVLHLTYVEFSGGHEYLWWQNTFADGLIDLFGNKNPTLSPK